MAFIYILIGYLSGSIPTGVWYSKAQHNIDVRQLGSHNSGTTNVGRNFGAKAAITVAAVDVLKGWIPVLIARLLLSPNNPIVVAVAIATVIGHAYPLFAEFRGGKAVATSIGALVGFHFFYGLTSAILLLICLFLTSTVSLSAMLSYTLTCLIMLLVSNNKMAGIGFLLIALFMIYRHRDNIKRLINKTERRINFGLNPPQK